jgi:hypothetical protein
MMQGVIILPITRRLLLLFLIISAAAPLTFCQSERSVSVALINESTAIPFTRFITAPVHPGIQIGTETAIKTYTHTCLFVTLHIGYYYHKSFAQGIYVKPSLGYEYRHKSGIALSGRLGLGYLHTFATQQEYKLVKGEYERKADAGNARLMPALTVSLDYYFRPGEPNSPKVFFAYESWIEYPFSPGFIPAMTHVTSQIGMQFYPFKGQTSHE